MERKFSELKVPQLKDPAKQEGHKGYSKLRKAELIALLTATRTRPLKPTRPPTPPPTLSPSTPKPDRLLEEGRQLTARQMKRRRNKANKLNQQIKSSERELERLRSKRDSIINKNEGAQIFKSQERKRIRKLNRELVKIDDSISKFEKVLDSAIDRLEPTHPPTKRIERKISELNKKLEELREMTSKKL